MHIWLRLMPSRVQCDGTLQWPIIPWVMPLLRHRWPYKTRSLSESAAAKLVSADFSMPMIAKPVRAHGDFGRFLNQANREVRPGEARVRKRVPGQRGYRVLMIQT